MTFGAMPPLVVTTETLVADGAFVHPNAWQQAAGRVAGTDQVVCRVGFGVSPLNDRIYVDGLEVLESHRRQGFGRALLVEVARLASPAGSRLPVTPLYELWASSRFWQRLRTHPSPGLVVTLDLRGGELEDERRRWQASVPSATHGARHAQ